MSFEAHTTEDRRLVILRALEQAAQYSINELLLKRYCERVGHSVSSDRIAQDLAWLREQGLAVVTSAEGISIATLTVRGMDVANGRSKVPGVAPPQPGV